MRSLTHVCGGAIPRTTGIKPATDHLTHECLAFARSHVRARRLRIGIEVYMYACVFSYVCRCTRPRGAVGVSMPFEATVARTLAVVARSVACFLLDLCRGGRGGRLTMGASTYNWNPSSGNAWIAAELQMRVTRQRKNIRITCSTASNKTPKELQSWQVGNDQSGHHIPVKQQRVLRRPRSRNNHSGHHIPVKQHRVLRRPRPRLPGRQVLQTRRCRARRPPQHLSG